MTSTTPRPTAGRERPAKGSAERMARKRASDRAKGLSEVTVRVPAQQVERIKEYADFLRRNPDFMMEEEAR